MPWWTTVFIALGGLLIGGAWSFYRQEAPRWVWIGVGVCGILAVVAGFLLVPA